MMVAFVLYVINLYEKYHMKSSMCKWHTNTKLTIDWTLRYWHDSPITVNLEIEDNQTCNMCPFLNKYDMEKYNRLDVQKHRLRIWITHNNYDCYWAYYLHLFIVCKNIVYFFKFIGTNLSKNLNSVRHGVMEIVILLSSEYCISRSME